MRYRGRENPFCLECGQQFAAHSWLAEFCSSKHRLDFGNRRRARGSELYDSMMFEKFASKDDKDRARRVNEKRPMVAALLKSWRVEDNARRGGRRSWSDPAR